MKPGRELDALVAVKVMGLSVDFWNYPHGGEPKIVTGVSPNMKALYDLPNYSTDIGAAWEVVEKLTGPKMAFSLSTLWDQSKNQFQWIAKVEFWGTDRFEFATADTAPHSICIAALKAIGVHV